MVFAFGPAPDRTPVSAAQVRALVAAQLPQWAHLPVEPVARGGWDNWTFHLGDALLVRLPSAAEYALAVDKEHRWLPALAQHLPVDVPTPVAKGAPGAGFAHPWSVYRWIDGRTAHPDRIADQRAFAADVAAFLAALQAVDPADGPRPGVHCWFRGGPLATFDPLVQRALPALVDRVDVAAVRRAWTQAQRVPWDGVERWFHGDVAEGNLLLDDRGALTAVIDFGTCGVGDPACDLAVAWTLLDGSGREELRTRLGVDDATWARGRGWALWKAVTTASQALDDPDELARAEQVLRTVLREEG